MKKLLLILLCLPLIGFGQSVPQGINYQAVARDVNGGVLMNQELEIRLSVISDIITGNISWQEIHLDTTNNYGLFTAIIGQGISTSIGTSPTFDVIDWGSTDHFLKLEIDYGSGYVDMGTTAFMSVPYAIYSNNGSAWLDSGSDIYFSSGNVGFGISNPEHRIHAISSSMFDTAAVIYSNSFGNAYAGYFNNFWSANKAKFGGFNYAGNFIGDVNISGDVSISGDLFQDSSQINTYKVGDFAHGGVVFWVDETGQHGLVCVKFDQNVGSTWLPAPPALNMVNCYGDGIGAGHINTIMILMSYNNYTLPPGVNSYPANDCVNLSIIENNILYGDWYLPSKYELGLMYLSKQIIDSTSQANSGSSFLPYSYWSSTQSTTQYANAWAQDFGTGIQSPDHKSNNSNHRTRAIRRF